MAFELNPENAIHIPSYLGEDADDNELEKITDFLLFLKDVGNYKIIDYISISFISR